MYEFKLRVLFEVDKRFVVDFMNDVNFNIDLIVDG